MRRRPMPDLQFQITGVEPARHGLTPLLHFKLRIQVSPPDETVQALILQSQIQIRAPQRSYVPREKRNLFEIFGPAESWGQTLGNRLWTYASTTTGAFTGSIDATLPVPCTF